MTPPRGTPIARLPRASKRDILRTTFDGDTESEILAEIRKALGREPDLVLWRLSQGGAMAREGGQTYRAGLSVNGAADLVGMLTLPTLLPTVPPLRWVPGVTFGEIPVDCVYMFCGRFIALEVKTPKHLKTIQNAIAKGTTAKLSKSDRAQIQFLGVVRSRGGFGAFVDSVESAQAALARARSGACE